MRRVSKIFLRQIKQGGIAQDPLVALAGTGQFDDALRESVPCFCSMTFRCIGHSAVLKRLPRFIESIDQDTNGLRIERSVCFRVNVEVILHTCPLSPYRREHNRLSVASACEASPSYSPKIACFRVCAAIFAAQT